MASANQLEKGLGGPREHSVAPIDRAVSKLEPFGERDGAKARARRLEDHRRDERDAEAHRHVPLDDLEARELERDAKGRSRGAQVGLDEAARETLLAEEDERRLGD